MANTFTMTPNSPTATPPVGAVPCTMAVTDSSTGLPIPRMCVYATSDTAGLIDAAGPALTSDQGEAVLQLVPGQTYYLTGLKLGVWPIVNRSFVAAADGS